MHTKHCRIIKDGGLCWEVALGDQPVVRRRTELIVLPPPSRRDAIGQHTVARVLARAGYTSHPPYRPES